MSRNLEFPKIFLFEFEPDEEIVWCTDDESGDGEVCEYVPAAALAERDATIKRLTRERQERDEGFEETKAALIDADDLTTTLEGQVEALTVALADAGQGLRTATMYVSGSQDWLLSTIARLETALNGDSQS